MNGQALPIQPFSVTGAIMIQDKDSYRDLNSGDLYRTIIGGYQYFDLEFNAMSESDFEFFARLLRKGEFNVEYERVHDHSVATDKFYCTEISRKQNWLREDRDDNMILPFTMKIRPYKKIGGFIQ